MFNQGQSTHRPSGLYHSPSTNDLRSKRGVFTNAALSTLPGQDDSIQHNFRYQVDREKIRRDAEAAELNKLRRFQSDATFQTLSNVHPNAYKSYANNLDKIGHNGDQIETYANEVQSAKERLFQDQQSMLNLQKLNRLNAEQHKQHLQKQMNRIRDPVRENDFPPFRPAVNTKSVDNVASRNYINDTEQDLKLSLLDKFSLNNGLEDQLSSFTPGGNGGLTGRSNNGLDNSRDYGDMSRYMGGTAGTRAPTSSFRPNLMQREPREPVQQYSPYLPSSFNPQPQPQPQPYYPAPGYGYNAPPPSSENLEMKVYMQKQTDLLERISDKLAKRKNESREKPRRETRDFENRFRDFEKETELRMQLMKQQQTIENLQTQNTHTQPKQRQNNESRQSRYRNNDEPNKGHGHYHSQSQPDIFNPQNLVQSFMQHMNPFGYNANPSNNPLVNSLLSPSGYDPYMNPYAYGMYPDQYNMFSPYPYSASLKDKKKKRKKSKKRAKSSAKSDSDDTDSDKSDTDSDTSGRSRRRSKSSKKKKDRKDKDKDKKSKDKKGSKKGGKDGGEDGEGGLSPEERKKKALSSLRTILWTIAYQKIFETDISQKVTNRRAAHQQDIYDRLDPIAQNFATWLMNVAQEGFTKLFDDVKKTYDFVGLDFKKPARSDVVKRSAEAKKQTKVLIEILIAKTDANPIDNQNLEFLTGVCYKNVYLSDNTFSVFELMRIRSNAWGRIPEMTKEHSQMILTCILIIRLLVFQLVFKANEWNKKIKWTPQALANFKIVGSLLYRIAYSMWEEMLPVVTEKPSQLGCAPIPALTLDPVLAPVDDTPDNPEMIFGALSKAQLVAVLEEDKQWTDSIKQLLLDWTSNIYNKIEAYRLQNPAKEPQLALPGGEGLANQAVRGI